MDNKDQIEEIKRYKEHLSKILGYDIEVNAAALIWIERYAAKWRNSHPRPEPCMQ